MSAVSRRGFLKTTGLAATHLLYPQVLLSQPTGAIGYDEAAVPDQILRRRISVSDLIYAQPVTRSEEGMPIGNGSMGTLVWTTPSRLKMQINRVDVYASNSSSNSFVEPHNDYCGGCAFLDVDFEAEVFSNSGFRQHLQVFDGNIAIQGNGVKVEIFATNSQDVIAIRVEDARSPRQFSVSLRALRYNPKYAGGQMEANASQHVSTVQTRSHSARATLLSLNQSIALTQEFREASYVCQSAVAIQVPGISTHSEIASETEVILRGESDATYCILIGSSASFDPKVNIAAQAASEIQKAAGVKPAQLQAASQDWWHTFWRSGSLELTSEDGTAEFIQANYHYFLYLMASSSQGNYPVKFNGMLWNTAGDFRMWGAQHWWTNLSCYYEAIHASGRFGLARPLFDMYSGMFASCETAARQEWGSEGIYIPETVYFDGLERLPDNIASEMQALYLERKPWNERSASFLSYAATKHPYSSVWNFMAVGHWIDGKWIVPERGDGPYGPTSHWLTATAKIPYLYWRHFEYTQDRAWLRNHAYPMLRGAVEFYRHHPNVSKDSAGRYHICGTNNGEPVKGAHDATEDLAAMRATTAALLRAADILQLDAEMRPVWQEFKENISPLPTSHSPAAIGVEDYRGPEVIVTGLKPVVHAGPKGMVQDINSLPTWYFDFSSVETTDQAMVKLSQSTLEEIINVNPDEEVRFGGLSKLAVAAASLGRTVAMTRFAPAQMRGPAMERSATYNKAGALLNRMSLLEGTQALGAEHLGRASEALHMALLQSNPPAPAEAPIIHCFPAWPHHWDASFTLCARGGFSVTASIQGGQVRLFELKSNAGSHCRVRNPYSGFVILYRNGKRAESLNGSLLEFSTVSGEIIEIRQQSV